MAAATSLPPSIDLSALSAWPISLGSSIARRNRASGYTSVHYNHTRRPADSIRLSRLTTTRVEAEVQAGDQTYKYHGKRRDTSDHYVLIWNGDDSANGMVLERLDSVHVLNDDQHDHLDIEDEMRTGKAEVAENDQHAGSPFDFKQFLLVEPRPKSSTTATRRAKPAVDDTPPSKKFKPLPKTASATSRNAKSSPPVPTVRLARKATLCVEDDDDDDDGELILEGGDDALTHKRNGNIRSSMALALTGQLGPGPISLHSAANSPASQFHSSPLPERPELDDGESVQIGSVSDGQDAADEQEEDGDVDDLELGSPIQDRDRTQQVHAPAPIDDNEEDDLSKELMRELEDVDGPSIQPTRSDEESEEE